MIAVMDYFRKIELKSLVLKRDNVKKEARTLEAQVNELQEIISRAKRRQPSQDVRKKSLQEKKNSENRMKGLKEPIMEQASTPEDITGLKVSILEKNGGGCCVIF